MKRGRLALVLAPAATLMTLAARTGYAQSVSWYPSPPGTGQSIQLAAVSPDGAAFTSVACCDANAFGYPWVYLYRPSVGYEGILSVPHNGAGCCGQVSAGALSLAGEYALSTVLWGNLNCLCYTTTSFRYHYPSGTRLGDPTCCESIRTSGISADGSVVVGTSLGPNGDRAYRWAVATGMVDLGVVQPHDLRSGAMAVSSDGSVVVGTSAGETSVTLFRWTAATGTTGLATFPLDPGQQFTAAAAESATFVGYNVVGDQDIPFRWTPGGGMESLPGYGVPAAVSADGNRVVGGESLWSPATGTVALQAYMQSLGVQFSPQQVMGPATCISNDGLHVGGDGLGAAPYRVWIAHLPPAPPCGSADFDCDGDSATDADIESFFACLAGDCPLAPCTSTVDFNGDGDSATDADIEAFFRVLAGGTC